MLTCALIVSTDILTCNIVSTLKSKFLDNMIIIIAFLYNELTYWNILLWPNFGNISIVGQNASLIGLYYNYCSSIDQNRSDSKKQRKNNQFTVVLLCRTAQLSKWPWIYRPTNVRADEWIYGWKRQTNEAQNCLYNFEDCQQVTD